MNIEVRAEIKDSLMFIILDSKRANYVRDGDRYALQLVRSRLTLAPK